MPLAPSLLLALLPLAHAEPDAAAPAAADAPAAEAPAKKKPGFLFEATPGKGITIGSDDGRYSLNVRGRLQLRASWDVSPPDDDGARTTTQLWNIATARLVLSGTVLSKDLRYLIQLAVAGKDFREPGNPSPLFDAALDYQVHPALHVKVGQFFVPFDRLRTVREFALQLPDRPRPVSELNLDRDVGVDLYSSGIGGKDGVVGYHLGVFGGGGINLTSPKPLGALFVGRLELRPLGKIDDDSEGDLEHRRKPGLALGGAVAYNLNTNRQKSTTSTTFTGGTASYLHAAADLVFKWRGVAVAAEYLYRKADVDTIASVDADGAPVTEFTRSGQGVVAQLSYDTPIDLEIATRFSKQWTLSDATDPKLIADVKNRGNEVAAGLSYYLNGHRLKVQAGWSAWFGADFGHAEHVVSALVDATF